MTDTVDMLRDCQRQATQLIESKERLERELAEARSRATRLEVVADWCNGTRWRCEAEQRHRAGRGQLAGGYRYPPSFAQRVIRELAPLLDALKEE